MRDQGAEACQEEEDKERDQDPAEPERRAECGCPVGCCEGQPKQDAFVNI